MQIKTECSFIPSHQPLYQGIFGLTKSLQQTYPNYKNWYEKTFLDGLKKGEREIIVALENKKIIGCALIKNTRLEKKLCTLFVHPNFRRQGIGEQLLKTSIQKLGQNPLVSVSQENKPFVDNLFRKYNFHLSAMKKGFYQPNTEEYYFNDERADAVQNKIIPILIQRKKQLIKNQ